METQLATKSTFLNYREAVRCLLEEFVWNPWFSDCWWPENEPRIRFMARLARDRIPVDGRALEVGCASGYVAYLFSLLGFEVTAVDAYDDPKRDELFRKASISYQKTNLNERAPLSGFPPESFDLVLLGEVFEHILNQPAGLLKDVFSLLRPGGLLILTTPNPSTLANAIRLLQDRYLLWGTDEFLHETKVDSGKIIDRGDIHYREYPAWVIRDLMAEIGYRVEGIKYVQSGIAPSHPHGKRSMKRLVRATGLGRLRLLSLCYVIWASRPA